MSIISYHTADCKRFHFHVTQRGDYLVSHYESIMIYAQQRFFGSSISSIVSIFKLQVAAVFLPNSIEELKRPRLILKKFPRRYSLITVHGVQDATVGATSLDRAYFRVASGVEGDRTEKPLPKIRSRATGACNVRESQHQCIYSTVLYCTTVCEKKT